MAPATPSVLRPTGLPELELHRPANLAELFQPLIDGAQPLAGGTDLLLWASQRGAPRHLVWTGGVGELHDFEPGSGRIRVGAAVTATRVLRSEVFRAAAPAVADGAHAIGSVQLRNQATLVGNVCTASPSGDTIPGLLVHDAEVEITNVSGANRRVGLDRFLIGPGRTALQSGELVIAVNLSRIGPREASAFRRFTLRQALDLAFASVAARIAFEADGRTVAGARLALGAVGETAIEVAEAAAMLVGRPLSDAGLQACAEAASQACSPISDHRASAEYRHQLVRVLVRDVINEAGRRAQATERQSNLS